MGKKFKKQLVSFTLLTCMFLSLAGCNKPDSDLTDNTEGTGHVSANYTVDLDTVKLTADSEISDILYGIFFEDINYSVDAGVYAEMIKNRSFEYGNQAANGNKHGWAASNASVLKFGVVDGSTDGSALNNVNPHYAVLQNSSASDFEGIRGTGYLDGIAIEAGAKYIVSFYMKGLDSYDGKVRVAIEDKSGTTYGEAIVDKITDAWWKYEVTLTASATINKDLRLAIEITKGSAAVDMISMMPEDTFAGLPIRKDIGEALADLSPAFIRFPGGCAVEGRDEASKYNWKDSIGNGAEFVVNGETTVGDVAVRPQGVDIWSGTASHPYYTTHGIGFYEYFALCDALDALPIPILNAGMTCPIQSGNNYRVYDINSEEFKQCVQDALDLVEFCLGDASTYWGSVRIAMGHEGPFALKYIGIGNEQWQSEYHQHYRKFVEAFEQAAKKNPALYGDIELIVANGPVSTDKYGYNYLKTDPDTITTLVDEHFYETADWFYFNTNRYDSYDRNMQADVFLGEYAAKANTMNAALAEAAFMTGLERNSDIVKMACYAPLFGNSTLSQWTPDMIFFSNNRLNLTPNYYVQQLFANNLGVNILPSSMEVGEMPVTDANTGKIGLGSWMTSVSYDDLKVVSNVDGSVLYETDFSSDTTLEDDNWLVHKGKWAISDDKLVQSSKTYPSDGITGDVVYVGDSTWSNYTLTVKGTILSGNEGFLIPICVGDKDNNIFWNLGGWNNTVSCLEIVDGGVKSGQVSGTVRTIKLKQNQEYEIKIVVEDSRIRCYLNDRLYIDYQPLKPEPLFETASIDANGDIILKLINTTDQMIDINVALQNVDLSQYNTTASVTTLASENLSATNTFENPDLITPVNSTLPVDTTFVYTAPGYSVSILRIPHK